MITLPSPSALSKFIDNIRGAIDPLGSPAPAPVSPPLSKRHLDALQSVFDLGDILQAYARPAEPARGYFPAVPPRCIINSAAGEELVFPQVLIDDLVACGLLFAYGGITDAGIEMLNAIDLAGAQ